MKEEFPQWVQTMGPVIASLDAPPLSPKVISFECLDTRLLKAYRRLSRELGIKRGELYPNKTKGAVNDLLCSNESIKLNCHETIDLLVQNGVDTIILTAHTDCAADKKLYGVRPHDEDMEHQKQKLKKAFLRIHDYSKSKLLNLKIRCFLLDVVEAQGDDTVQVSIMEVFHDMSTASQADTSEAEQSSTVRGNVAFA